MGKFETKFNIDDDVYVVIDEVVPSECLDPDELFETAMKCMRLGRISSIVIGTNGSNDFTYHFYGKDFIGREYQMFATRKEAFDKVMGKAVLVCKNALGYAEELVKICSSDEEFNACLDEYKKETK